MKLIIRFILNVSRDEQWQWVSFMY